MHKLIYSLILVVLAVNATIFFHDYNSGKNEETLSEPVVAVSEKMAADTSQVIKESVSAVSEPVSSAPITKSQYGKVYSRSELLALADNKYASGDVPLGDDKYVTDAPKKGYVYLCRTRKDNPGSSVNGPWIQGSTWNFLNKLSILGSVSWPNAVFSAVVSGTSRVLTGNGLPVWHNTGVFPVAANDPAAAYDRNPNTIKAQTLSKTLPTNPTYLDTPVCMGGEVGIMNSGVPLFNAFDAGLRDAPAHELQDSCAGHPQGSGQYHYHSLPSCFKDFSVSKVLGYALDGFPITGPIVEDGKYLTTEDLDVCHGITSEVMIDGKAVSTYHYVMTYDFPYSASCFRGKPVSYMVIGQGQQQGGQAPSQNQSMQQLPMEQSQPSGGQQGQPPQQAIDACVGKSASSSCSVQTPQGSLSGVCRNPPNSSSLACIPN